MDVPAQIIKATSLTAKRLWASTRGSIAQLAAVAIPCCALVSIGAAELVAVSASESRFQSIADAGALEGAHHLSLAVDPAVVRERTASFVEAQFDGWSDAPAYQGTYEIVDWNGQSAIRVLLNGNRPSFFANLLPRGGWKFRGEATAAPVGKTPLCVLAIGDGSQPRPPVKQFVGDMIHLKGPSAVESPDCGVHSEQNITLEDASKITGRRIQARKAVKGATEENMKPAAGIAAAQITDPFASMRFPSLNGCHGLPPEKLKDVVYGPGGTFSLPAGTHCGRITVQTNATLKLEPGDHFFRKSLTLSRRASLTGEDVFLFFDHGSDPWFNGLGASVELIGRKSGTYAGMVMATIGGNTPDIPIPGENVKKLEGVVYVPKGLLEVTGKGTAAAESNWTVIVAAQIKTAGSATIRINSDYESSDVPVPNGVGPTGGLPGGEGTRLID